LEPKNRPGTLTHFLVGTSSFRGDNEEPCSQAGHCARVGAGSVSKTTSERGAAA
jgi:hypothetical protein